jgi:osmotically-inducible protein OsmY
MMTRARRPVVPPQVGPGRTDGDIFGEARSALDRHLDIPQTVHVHVAGGVATLTGVVQSPGEQMRAEETVRRVHGVRQVLNRMTLAHAINPQGFEPPDTR